MAFDQVSPEVQALRDRKSLRFDAETLAELDRGRELLERVCEDVLTRRPDPEADCQIQNLLDSIKWLEKGCAGLPRPG